MSQPRTAHQQRHDPDRRGRARRARDARASARWRGPSHGDRGGRQKALELASARRDTAGPRPRRLQSAERPRTACRSSPACERCSVTISRRSSSPATSRPIRCARSPARAALHLNKPVKAKELMHLIQRCLAVHPPAQADIGSRRDAGDGRDRQPSSWSMTTAPCARRCAICSRQTAERSRSIASCEAFLDAYRPGRDGCLLVDARMPGMSGLELLQRLKGERHPASGDHDHRPWRRADGGPRR